MAVPKYRHSPLFRFQNPSPKISKLVVDLRTTWPHHINKGLYRKWIRAVDPISFVFRIFRVSPLNSKILASSPRILLIPKDRGVGGRGGVLFMFYDVHIPRCAHIKTNGTQCGSPALRE